MRFNYQNFNGRIGDSDIHGSLSYTTGKPRPKLSGDMESKQLRLADLGPLIGVDSGKGRRKALRAAGTGRSRRVKCCRRTALKPTSGR